MTMGLIGLVLISFRFVGAFVLSARFWLVIWFGFTAYWLVKILRYQYKHLPENRDKAEKEKMFRKYLPKRK